MNSLSLDKLAIDAHGGLDRWRRFKTVSARLLNGGALWPLKHQQGVLDDLRVRVDLRNEWASHWPFTAPNLRTSFQPHRVAIETTEGQPVEELLQPRDSFKGHSVDTPWTRLQLAYFVGCAMWTYLNTPFLFALDGVKTEEIEPWRENGETWRRLRGTFPPNIASHSTIQTFYFDAEGLLKRHDYDITFRCRGQQGHDDRSKLRTRCGGRQIGLDQEQCAPMRLLPVGTDHVRCCFARVQSEALA
jgi:hypothetical protein